MNERFSRFFTCQPNLGVEDTPILIKAGGLLLDNQTQNIIAQFRLQNISDKTITLVKIKITPYDSIDRPLDDAVIHSYLDLNCKFQEEFGSKKAIFMPNPATRAFTVSVLEVAFDDGSNWINDIHPWCALPENSLTIARFSARVAYLEALKLKDANTIPTYEQAIELFNLAADFEDVEILILECESGITELNKKILQKAEDKKRQVKTAKKAAIITVPSLIGLILILALIFSVIIPNVKYRKAVDHVYADEDGEAIKIFNEIYPFSNSDEYISFIYERALARAKAAYIKGDAKEAYEILCNVGYDGDETQIYYLIQNGNFSTAVIDYNLDTLVIPKGTTEIETRAFKNCTTLKSITIPNSVKTIGSSAFSGCSNLTSITLPYSVSDIESYAFSGCSSLTSINIPDSVTSIGYNAFTGCSSLEFIFIPISVSSIFKDAFNDCYNLTIMCEAPSLPVGWDNTSYSNWNYSDCPVFWGATGETYTYTFMSNGGPHVNSIISENAITLPELYVEGYHFMGWYDNPNFTGEALTSPYYSTTNHTLYARWVTESAYLESLNGSSFD